MASTEAAWAGGVVLTGVAGVSVYELFAARARFVARRLVPALLSGVVGGGGDMVDRWCRVIRAKDRAAICDIG